MDDPKSLPQTPKPQDAIPAFTCVVYVASIDGEIRGRVANLSGLEVTGKSERDVLAQLVPKFREVIAQYRDRLDEIPWVDPPPQPTPDEQSRYLPVHL